MNVMGEWKAISANDAMEAVRSLFNHYGVNSCVARPYVFVELTNEAVEFRFDFAKNKATMVDK